MDSSVGNAKEERKSSAFLIVVGVRFHGWIGTKLSLLIGWLSTLLGRGKPTLRVFRPRLYYSGTQLILARDRDQSSSTEKAEEYREVERTCFARKGKGRVGFTFPIRTKAYPRRRSYLPQTPLRNPAIPESAITRKLKSADLSDEADCCESGATSRELLELCSFRPFSAPKCEAGAAREDVGGRAVSPLPLQLLGTETQSADIDKGDFLPTPWKRGRERSASYEARLALRKIGRVQDRKEPYRQAKSAVRLHGLNNTQYCTGRIRFAARSIPQSPLVPFRLFPQFPTPSVRQNLTTLHFDTREEDRALVSSG
ncbi:hypothetical protein ISN45_Un97g000230 (mitochondrion) [Arabidopsis thaliana x Arabidopsis arenosa]|uniref:Uncharacterized protein n=2 Tax=Arabidopsis TaxID=3701 RepID=A0A8T1XCH0_ARASU|nr:hypothetical protein ISN45_Un97g000230 [Arabidopsis thaliana x Arabidopsis arenosa]KAG7529351.1 hypothetical protein ISN44_Un143g000420 [Arabidopsis suecica]